MLLVCKLSACKQKQLASLHFDGGINTVSFCRVQETSIDKNGVMFYFATHKKK